jgi:hypothetical protein
VEAKIEALDGRHRRAGRYRQDAPDRTLRVAPETGCLVTDSGCMGICGLDRGGVREETGLLRASWT